MDAYDEELSLQYHSIRLYYGVYDTEQVSYRIGDSTTTVDDEVERFYDTWTDFHLIPAARPTVPLPKANSKFVTIPGRKDPIDMSNYLTGHTTFENRCGSWTFYTDTDFVNRKGGWANFDKDLRNKLHGRIFKIVLRDDPSFFYVGELTMEPWATGKDRSSITIGYNVYPYKKDIQCSMDRWKFDEFDFENGIIQYMRNMQVHGTRVVKIYGSKERISPRIARWTVGTMYVDKYENDQWVRYGTVPYVENGESIDNLLESPRSIVPRLIIEDDLNQLRFVGQGYVTVDYRRGLL